MVGMYADAEAYRLLTLEIYERSEVVIVGTTFLCVVRTTFLCVRETSSLSQLHTLFFDFSSHS